jgi:hypothetical protein
MVIRRPGVNPWLIAATVSLAAFMGVLIVKTMIVRRSQFHQARLITSRGMVNMRFQDALNGLVQRLTAPD